jgi:hypothetical protein
VGFLNWRLWDRLDELDGRKPTGVGGRGDAGVATDRDASATPAGSGTRRRGSASVVFATLAGLAAGALVAIGLSSATGGKVSFVGTMLTVVIVTVISSLWNGWTGWRGRPQ